MKRTEPTPRAREGRWVVYRQGSPDKASPPGAGPKARACRGRGRGRRCPRSPLTSCSPRWTRRGKSGPRYSSPAAARPVSWTPSSFCPPPPLQLPAAPSHRRETEAGVSPAPQSPGKCSPRRPPPGSSHDVRAAGGGQSCVGPAALRAPRPACPAAPRLAGCRLPALRASSGNARRSGRVRLWLREGEGPTAQPVLAPPLAL